MGRKVCCAPLPEGCRPWIVDTEKVLLDADGPMKRAVPRPAMRDGWKGVRPWVRVKSRTVRAGEEPEEHKRKHGRRAQKFIFHHWWTYVFWKKLNWRQSTQSTNVDLYFESTLWKMILDLMQDSLNKDQQHLKWQQQKVMDIITRLPGCAGQAADAISVETQVIMEDTPKLLKIPKIGMSGHLDSSSSMEDPVVPLERNLYGHPLAGLLWERQFEKILLKHGWEKVSKWECLFVHREKGLFLSVYVDDINLAGKKQNLDPLWKVLSKEVDLGEPTSFLDLENLGCTQWKCEISKESIDYYRTMFESWISECELQNLHTLRIFSSWSYDMEGHGKKCVSDIVSCQIRRLNNSTKYLLHALMTILPRKNLKSVVNCQKYALKLSWNACTWLVLDHLMFYGQWTNLLGGPEMVKSMWQKNISF